MTKGSIAKIAEIVSTIELDRKTAERLIDEMDAYKAKYPRSFKGIMESTVARKLWDAIDEAAETSLVANSCGGR